MRFRVTPSNSLQGNIKVAGDKSVSHRSIIFGSLAHGTTTVSGILEGEDVLATIRAFAQMGVNIERTGDNNYIVAGVGLDGLQEPDGILDMGNSGTAFRLLAGIMSAQPFPVILAGDESLSQRPMDRIINPLSLMGADIKSTLGKPPLEFTPVARLDAIHYTTPMASAQVKSAVLLAGLYARGETSVTENTITRDHTERMLRGFGYGVRVENGTISLDGGGKLQGQYLEIPSDLSSAAFFILAALITPDSELLLHKVGINPSRNGVLKILQRMGGQIQLENRGSVGGEPVADIRVAYSRLTGCSVSPEDVALSIDEIPVIAIAAACARGTTTISGAEELRVKESDRISAMAEGLQTLGIDVTEHPDGMTVYGGELQPGRVESYGDHRIAMAFAIAGCAATGPVEVLDCTNVATSFPDFRELASQCGITIEAFDEELTRPTR